MRALVTGATGFVGRHMLPALTARGYDVAGIDSNNGYGSIDCRAMFSADYSERYDLVVHLAANVGGRRSIDNTPLWVAQNLGIDAAMFAWAVRTHQPRVVYYSSSAAYPVGFQRVWGDGRPMFGPLAETDIDLDEPELPDGTYGWAKLTGERLAQYAAAAGVRVHVFRPFSGYGTDQGEDYPFGAFLARVRRQEDPFDIWGPGTQVRDWIHIDDVVAGTLAAVEHDLPGPVNLCTGVGADFRTLARMFAGAGDYQPEYRHLEAEPTGVMYRVGDPTLLNTFYQPTVDLAEGIRRALAA